MCTRRVVEDEVLFDAGSCSGGVGEEKLDDVLDDVRFISPFHFHYPVLIQLFSLFCFLFISEQSCQSKPLLNPRHLFSR